MVVVVLHKDIGVGLGFSMAGGADQNKPITVRTPKEHLFFGLCSCGCVGVCVYVLGMLTTQYFVSRRVWVMRRQIDRFIISCTATAAVADLKGSALSFKTAARLSYFKGCSQEHTNNAFFFKVHINDDKQNITEHRAGL